MDTKKYAQGENLTLDFVKTFPKQEVLGLIVSDAEEKQTKFGNKLVVKVSVDKIVLNWTMNQTSVRNMNSLSTDSIDWLSKKVLLKVVMGKDNKEQLIGAPIIE